MVYCGTAITLWPTVQKADSDNGQICGARPGGRCFSLPTPRFPSLQMKLPVVMMRRNCELWWHYWRVGVTAGEEKTLRKLFFNSDPTAIDLGLDCPVRQTRLRKAFDKFVFRRELAPFTPQGSSLLSPLGTLWPGQLRTSWWREHSLRWVVTPPPCLWLSWCHPPLSLSLPLFSDYPPCLTESPPSPSPTCFAHFTFQ